MDTISKTETISKYKMMDILHLLKLSFIDDKAQATSRVSRNRIAHGILVINLIVGWMRRDGLITQEEYDSFMECK